MRETVRLLQAHAAELGATPLVVIGGGTLDEETARFVGADRWTTDAMEGVRICQRLMAEAAARPVGLAE
jgi:methanogenic corrinoid protein MtbC1